MQKVRCPTAKHTQSRLIQLRQLRGIAEGAETKGHSSARNSHNPSDRVQGHGEALVNSNMPPRAQRHIVGGEKTHLMEKDIPEGRAVMKGEWN